MKAIISCISFLLLASGICQAQQTNVNPEARIKELGILLITPTPPIANYVKAVRVGNMVYLSGHGPDKPEGGLVTGKVGSARTAKGCSQVNSYFAAVYTQSRSGRFEQSKTHRKSIGYGKCHPNFRAAPQSNQRLFRFAGTGIWGEW
jgi:hypothetical protein